MLKVTPERKVELLTDTAEGLKFKLTDGVDVAADGTIRKCSSAHSGPCPRGSQRLGSNLTR